MSQQFADAQAAFPFVIAQGRTIETRIYEARYPTYDYRNVLPVVTQGAEWAIGTQFATMDLTGEAKFLSGAANDIPFANAFHDLATKDYFMLGSGWEWNIEEINQAALYGIPLADAKARAASSSVERLLYNIAMTGSTEKNVTGFVNAPGVNIINAPADGTGSSALFVNKTPAQIERDLNTGLSAIPSATNEVEFADTVAFPPAVFRYLAGTRTGTLGDAETILQRFIDSNIYTATTGRPIQIKQVRALATAGADGGGRIVFYRNDEDVLRFHLPMPRMVLPVRQKSIMGFETGVIARTGGTEVRLPGAMLYLDRTVAAS